MNNPDIRWKQRFKNFVKAFMSLKEALCKQNLNELERNGLIQRFEFTIDLSWKVTKDFLEEEGFIFKQSPKETFRQAQEAGFIDYAQELIDGLDARIELSHDYSEEKFIKSEKILRNQVFYALERLYLFLLSENNK